MDHEALNLQNSAMKVCIDTATASTVEGRVFGRRLAAPMPFLGLGDLLLRLERLMDGQNFPQAYQRIRSFQKKQAVVYGTPHLPEGAMGEESVASAAGEVTTFFLRVLSRQSATWQGNVDWLDGSDPQEFSSDLEFLSLLEERLTPNA